MSIGSMRAARIPQCRLKSRRVNPGARKIDDAMQATMAPAAIRSLTKNISIPARLVERINAKWADRVRSRSHSTFFKETKFADARGDLGQPAVPPRGVEVRSRHAADVAFWATPR